MPEIPSFQSLIARHYPPDPKALGLRARQRTPGTPFHHISTLERSRAALGKASRLPVGRCQTHAPRLPIRTDDQVRQTGVRLCAEPQGASRPVSQPHTCRRRQDAVTLPHRRTGRSGSTADRCRPTVSDPCGCTLGGMRTMGRQSISEYLSLLQRRPKKGAPRGSPKRNRPGDRSPLRFPRSCRSGFRSRGDGGAAPGSAVGRARPGTTAERRQVRSRRTRNCLALAENRLSIEAVTRRPLKVCWGLCVWSEPTITAPGARVDSARATALLRLELFSLTPGVLRMTGSTAALVSFEESSSLLHELAGVKVSISQVQRAAETLGASNRCRRTRLRG